MVRTVAAIATAAVAVAVAAAPAVAQGCSPRDTVTSSSYDVALCGLPDYDQVRAPATSLGAAGYRLRGVQDDGHCRCVPTSFTNLLGYYAGKGVTPLLPQPFDWAGRSFTEGQWPRSGVAESDYDTSTYSTAEAARYEEATGRIRQLSIAMGTNGPGDDCGTSYTGLDQGVQSVLGLLSGSPIHFAFTRIGTGSPRKAAEAIANGATVLWHYKSYQVQDTSPMWIATRKNGGHVVTVRAVKGGGDDATLKVRDSNRDEPGDLKDVVRQSTFRDTTWTLTKRRGLFNGLFSSKWQMRDANDPASKGRFVEDLWVVWPQVYLVADSTFFSLSGTEFNFGAGAARAASAPEPAPRTFTRRFETGPLLDATFVPHTGEVAFVRRESRKLEAVNIRTGARRVVVATLPSTPVDLDTDARRGHVLVLGTSTLTRVRADPEQKTAVQSRRLRDRFESLAYDPTRDRVAITRPGSVAVFAGPSLSARPTLTVPRSLVAGSGRLASGFDSRGRLLLRRGAGGPIQRLGVGERASRFAPLSSAALGGGGFVPTDRGTVVTVSGGQIVELTPAGDALAGKASPKPGSGRLVSIIRNGFDVTPALAATRIDDNAEDDPNGLETAGDL